MIENPVLAAKEKYKRHSKVKSSLEMNIIFILMILMTKWQK